MNKVYRSSALVALIFILSNNLIKANNLKDTVDYDKEIQSIIDNNANSIDEINELNFKIEQLIRSSDSLDISCINDSIAVENVTNKIINQINLGKQDLNKDNKLILINKLKPNFDSLSVIERHRDSILNKKMSKLSEIEIKNKTITNGSVILNKLKDSISKFILLDTNKSLIKIRFRNKNYRILVIRNKNNEISIFDNHKYAPQSLNDIWSYSLSKRKKPIAAFNGGMYKSDYTPQGLLIEKFTEKQKIDTTNDPKNRGLNFYLFPNGVFLIDSLNQYNIVTTSDYLRRSKLLPKIKYATQSGPMLVINNKINSKFTFNSKNINIRNGVGVSNLYSNKYVFFAISDNPVSLYDISMLFKDVLGCNNALYLDGAISKMYTNEKNNSTGDLGGQFGPVILVEKK